MEIKGREISSNNFPLIIAEIGINHGGSLDVAKNMVYEAAKSGAECVKHQTHFVEDEMTEDAKEIFPPNANASIWEVIEKCALNRDEEFALKQYAEELGLIYISTPFSRAAADFLEEIDIPAFKIGSGECNNIPLVRHITKFKKPIIISTGMQSLTSLDKTVKILNQGKIDYALLECTNLYPSPPEFVSLLGISELSKKFPNTIIGFSDHSIGPHMALASIPLGASIIERHFTDTKYRKGPDISCSMDPSELSFLIKKSKEIYIASKNQKSRTTPEEDVYKFARSSLVADRDLKEGQIIKEEDIWARRPGNGEIPGYLFDEILGKKLKNSIKFNQQLKWENFVKD
ncbi:N-acetylneuraminate synthase family protein [Prochlorococcus marinus]|uniref:N-acetylneuraminate synthase family protein n=1 Tax=Prochlorococcus marinus TaxID=1219 RepID=UPI001AD96CB6|nr:N-acetylneuraminate synthase family protein [Prochlorococcus marinus]MBO8219511.1 polyhydroxyalkanoate biosynthesis repressor PhaR [Prochlorococcus marinus CUG1416]MBW3051882.1 polyhydroxyalkanoate biosynthesis repressor PhaR [Prochlorococcus marinus str. MU1416]